MAPRGCPCFPHEYDCGGCAGRLTAIRHRKAFDNSVIHDLTFVRDPLGNILNSTDAEGAHAYTYDPVRRLTAARHPANGAQPNEFYTYDAVGNRLTSHLSQLYSYSWQTQGKGDRLLQGNQFNYLYDDEGNLVRKTDRATSAYTDFVYDHRNRMTAVVRKTSVGVEVARFSFIFDTLNRRIQATDTGTVSYWAYDNLNPVLKFDSSKVVINRRMYSRNLDQAIADQTLTATRWFLTDQVGTTRDFTSNDGSLLNHYAFDSFGRLITQTQPGTGNDITFTGREFIGDSGLGYFRSRAYDSGNGRFIQEDPLAPRQYSYALSSPLILTDKTGMSEVGEIASLLSFTSSFLSLIKTEQEYSRGFYEAVAVRTQCRENTPDLPVGDNNICDVAFEAKINSLGWSLTRSFLWTALTFGLPPALTPLGFLNP